MLFLRSPIEVWPLRMTQEIRATSKSMTKQTTQRRMVRRIPNRPAIDVGFRSTRYLALPLGNAALGRRLMVAMIRGSKVAAIAAWPSPVRWMKSKV